MKSNKGEIESRRRREEKCKVGRGKRDDSLQQAVLCLVQSITAATVYSSNTEEHPARLVLGCNRSWAHGLLETEDLVRLSCGLSWEWVSWGSLGLGLRPNVLQTRVFQVRVQIPWGYVNTGSFKTIPNHQLPKVFFLKSTWQNMAAGREAPLSWFSFPPLLSPSPFSHITNKTILSST